MEAHGYLSYYLDVLKMFVAYDVGPLPLKDDYNFKSPIPAGLTSL